MYQQRALVLLTGVVWGAVGCSSERLTLNCGSGEIEFDGQCVEVCVKHVDCSDGLCCNSGFCEDCPAHCSDGAQNEDETGEDCGGSCLACWDEPSCNDGVQNQDETGVDCGGVCDNCPGTCDDDAQNQDETGIDCGGVCPACPPTCDDGVQNQDETGIDCGGVCLNACESCYDEIQNQDETGVDCGGVCISCSSPCTNEQLDNGETDVDCGGPECDPCANFDDCVENRDCSSGFCNTEYDVCYPPACDDGVQNGEESDVDCGGSCDVCLYEENCGGNGDCASGNCDNGSCGGIWMAIGYGAGSGIATSPDGINWTERATPVAGATWTYLVTHQGMALIISYDGDYAVSYNGINWETRVGNMMTVPDAYYARPIFFNGHWVAMFAETENKMSTGTGYMGYSVNGLDWTYDTSRDVGYWFGGYRIKDCVAGYCVAQRQSADDLLISTNGTTWTEATTGTAGTSSIYLTPSGSSWLTWHWLDAEIFQTTNFSSFTAVTTPFADGVAKQISYNAVRGRWVATDIDGPIKYTDNLNTWTAAGSPFTEYGTVHLVPSETTDSWLAHQWGDIAHSADGAAFAFVNTGLGVDEGIAFAREINGVWYLSGFNDTLHRSTNGTSWSNVTNPFDTETVRDIVFVGP